MRRLIHRFVEWLVSGVAEADVRTTVAQRWLDRNKS